MGYAFDVEGCFPLSRNEPGLSLALKRARACVSWKNSLKSQAGQRRFFEADHLLAAPRYFSAENTNSMGLLCGEISLQMRAFAQKVGSRRQLQTSPAGEESCGFSWCKENSSPLRMQVPAPWISKKGTSRGRAV